jgi:hypothetical protein
LSLVFLETLLAWLALERGFESGRGGCSSLVILS